MMTMSDDEILSAAGRLRAARRRRVAKRCEVCGTPFEGVAQRRYCSNACRMRASRRRQEESAMARISDCEELDVAGDRIGIRPETRRPASVRDEVATYDAAPVAPTTEMESDPIRDLLRAKGYLEDEHRPRPDPQGKDEPYVDYVERVSKWIMRGRVFSEDSVELLRQLRDERDAQLDRVAGSETAEG